MRPLLVSTSDLGHGAGISAYRLHRGLVAEGIDAHLLVAAQLSADLRVDQVPPRPLGTAGSLWRSVLHLGEHAVSAAGLQGCLSLATPYLLRHPWLKHADIVHLHNIHWHSRYFSLGLLPRLSRDKPLVWTIHDMWPLTGHCYNPVDCGRWREGCGNCPDLVSYIRVLFDTTAMMVRLKQRMIRGSRLTVVAPSRWMKDQVTASPIFADADVRHIPNGIDTSVFRPGDRRAVREELGIGSDCRVIMYAAAQVTDPRKGCHYLRQALDILGQGDRSGMVVLLTGGGSIPDGWLPGYRIVATGHIGEEARLARIYSAADLLVVPSLQENLSNVIMEGLACGTPVVCFDSSGNRDLVSHCENGYLARLADAADLAQGIRFLLDESERDRNLRCRVTESVRSRFDLPNVATEYVRLYEELLAKSGA